MTGQPPGWTPAEIREEIRKRGTTIYQLSRDHGLGKSWLCASILGRKRQPKGNRIIADFLGRSLHELWPHWYGPEEYRDTRRGRKVPAEVFEAILKRVEAGERVTAICREPGQPTMPTVQDYVRATPAFAERWRAAIFGRQGARIAPSQVGKAAERVLELVADGARVNRLERSSPEDALPCVSTIRRRMRGDEGFAERWSLAMGSRPGAKVSQARLNAVVDALKGGASLKRQTIVPAQTVRRYCRLDRDFAARLPCFQRAAPFAHLAHREAFVRALRQDEVYAVVEAAVPRHLPPDMRDDVKSDLVVALLTGEVQPDGAAVAAKRLITAYHRMFLHHDASFDADRKEGGLGGMLADPSSFSVEGTGHRVLMPGW